MASRTPPTPFRVDEALALADDVLSRPPARSHIERPVRRGALVARFALELKLCPPLNALAEMPGWRRKKLKDACLIRMLGQHGRRREPLPGRPAVYAVRLSSRATDDESGWCKIPVDRLQVGEQGHRELGFLRDDSPDAVELHAWWEPCPPKKGCVVIEVRA